MTAPPGDARLSSATVHLTDKKVPERYSRALTSRATEALAAISGMQTKNARRIVIAYASGQVPLSSDGWALWLRNWFQIADPTGETAARNVDRERGC